MIVFVGSEKKGFFCEEAAKKRDMELSYISADLHIENQTAAILRQKEKAQVVIYDLEQYADEAEELVNWIIRIQEALGVKTIVLADGFSPQSNLIQRLYKKGIRNYIFSPYLGEMKEDLELCLDGYYENFGYLEKRGISFEEEKEEEGDTGDTKQSRAGKAKTIGVAGALVRIGTTTQALQLVKYFQFFGQKAAYIQMNGHGYAEDVGESYERIERDDDLGRITYLNVDMYYRTNRLPDILMQDYDYLVFDYGVFSENGFNKISFLEKDIQIFVGGIKPGGEFDATYAVLENNFYNRAFYIFSFVAESERAEVKNLMEGKEEMTFFAEDTKDPFAFAGEGSIYEKIIPLEKNNPIPAKKKRFRKNRKS